MMWRYALWTSATILLMGSICACDPLMATGPCTMTAHNAHVSSGELRKRGVKVIDAKVTVNCDVAPNLHKTTATLERFANGEWVVMGRVVDQRIPPRKGITVRVDFGGCIPGHWRTRGVAEGQLNGEPFGPVEHTRGAEITEEDCVP